MKNYDLRISNLDIEHKLKSHTEDFKVWINSNPVLDEDGFVDYYSYPKWSSIEKDVAVLFNQYDVRCLSEDGINDLLWLVGKGSYNGTIINLFDKDSKSFSNIGPLNEKQFYFLCLKAIKVNDEDVQIPFVNSFDKFNELNPEREKILLRFLKETKGETQYLALKNLFRLQYFQIEELIEEAWRFDYWPTRHLCLNILKKQKSPMLDKYELEITKIEQDLVDEVKALQKKLSEKQE